jgi:flagellar basal body-associated protein FliL
VADDKKKEDSNDEGKKKGLSPLVMIAIGALVGGAGVVFAIPPKTVEVEVEAPPLEYVEVEHPDLILHTFNPRQRAGKGVAKVSFRFVFTVREDLQDAAYEAMKLHWNMANSKVLSVLRSRSVKELQSETGERMLEHDLIKALNEVFFHVEGGDPIAQITEIMWGEILLQ